MSIVVAQLGARMHYAVPGIFYDAGLLERLYTDICGTKGWPGFLRFLPRNWRTAAMQRLIGRIPARISATRIRAFNGFGLSYAWRLARARTINERNDAFLWSGREFCRLIIREGFGKAKTVYVFNSAGLEILIEARRRGLKGVLEQTIAPRTVEWNILKAESFRFPDWEALPEEDSLMEQYCARESAEWTAADLIICGSDFVKEGVVANGGPEDRCVVIPYGIEGRASRLPRSKRHHGRLRVLTVGAVCLRKGAPYVMEAAKEMGERAEFRMAGAIQVSPQASEALRQYVELVDVIPRSEMEAQYEWADVFLLPSLCEGSATATYEAMCHGLPVICTLETGSTVRDGIDGFIVPSRDSRTIAEKLARLATDIDLWEAMSKRALDNGSNYTLEKYGTRLLTSLREHNLIE